MKVLFIGDIFGSLGVKAIKRELPQLKTQHNIDIVIANAENTTQCRGLSVPDYLKLTELGIDVMTMGNHTWFQKDVNELLEISNVIRPFNLEPSNHWSHVGKGTCQITINQKKIRISSLMGKSVYCRWTETTNPFIEVDKLLELNDSDLHIVDFHSESTSEKNCMFHFLKGKVSAVVGTHTHVQTNDATIKNGTAYITDAGMTGPSDGIIGAEPDTLIEMFTEQTSHFRLKEASGNYQFNAVLMTFDDDNQPIDIQTIKITDQDSILNK